MLTESMRYLTYSVLKMQRMTAGNSLKSLFKTSTKSSIQIPSRNYVRNCKIKRFTVQNIQHENSSYFLVKNAKYFGCMNSVDRPYNRICYRLYSDMKDDKMVKSWLKEINEDFENDLKKGVNAKMTEDKSDKTSTSSSSNVSNSESDSDTDNLHSSLDEDFNKLEKLGFTTEEIIDLLKKSKFQENIEEEFEDSDSEHVDSSQKSEAEENTSQDSDVGLNKDNVQGDSKDVSDVNKMEDKKWAVVEMNTDVKTDWSAVEIEDFVNIAEAAEDTEDNWEPPVSLVRGENGVFEIDELITILRAANAQDIVTIKIPQDLNFADYMVIVSAKSLRHIQAILGDIRWIHKRKKNETDRYMRIEGDQSEWCAADLGNIILHVFMPALREVYDLETLWTVGAKFDPQCAEEAADPYVFSVDDLPWLKELEQETVSPNEQKT